MKEISTLIRSRRAYFPKMYADKEIPKELVEEILENANWAPTHKRTEPWRFKVFHSEAARQNLSKAIATAFKEMTPPEMYSEIKAKDISDRPIQSGCVLAICMKRNEAAGLPEWEEIAATAMAVQNIWLTCTSYGIGSYWATPGFVRLLADVLDLGESERCIGLFYMGYLKEDTIAPAMRGKMEEKVVWK